MSGPGTAYLRVVEVIVPLSFAVSLTDPAQGATMWTWLTVTEVPDVLESTGAEPAESTSSHVYVTPAPGAGSVAVNVTVSPAIRSILDLPAVPTPGVAWSMRYVAIGKRIAHPVV